MTPKEMTYKAIMKKLDDSQHGLFATHDSLESVTNYALALMKGSTLNERDFATYTVMGIYHNTLVKLLKDMVTETFADIDGITNKESEEEHF